VAVETAPVDGTTLRWMRDQILINLINDESSLRKSRANKENDAEPTHEPAENATNLFRSVVRAARPAFPNPSAEVNFALDFSIKKITDQG